jgi:hypothetical protein
MGTKMVQTKIDVHVTFNDQGIVISADIPSKSRPGLLHYTRIILDPDTLKTIKATCDCEGWTYRGKCWHIKVLEQITCSDEEVRKKIEEIKEDFMIFASGHDDVASWG